MKIDNLHPYEIISAPETGMQELMRTFLVRTNFVPGVRHVIGWRGLKDSALGTEAWTAKIKGFSGVFGLYFSDVENDGNWLTGCFGVTYFPESEEALVEKVSLEAAAYAQQEDYLTHVRDFLAYPKLSELFGIGHINLAIDPSEEALMLGLESMTRQRTVARDGIALPQEGRTVELVKPGGFDQDFPAYETLLAFFRVIAASIAFNLEAPPVYLKEMSAPGKEIVYDRWGKHWEKSSGQVQKEFLWLGFGEEKFDYSNDPWMGGEKAVKTKSLWKKGASMIAQFKDELWWKAHKISDFKTLDKQSLGIDDRPQLIVLTGFLGSGKTSFLQHFIEYQVQQNRFVAIIQNEIGEVGLDGKLLDHDYAVTEIDEGCVCCTLVGNLKKAIHQILASFHPDYIVLETTGLANPFNLLDEISELEDLVKFDSVTTVVDGVNIEKSLVSYEVAENQIKAADVLLLNKRDLLNEIQIGQVNEKLRSLNPRAPILTTAQGDINPALLYGIDPYDTEGTAHKKEASAKVYHNNHSHAADDLSSYRVSFTEPVNRERFIEAIKSIPEKVFRIKGVVEFVDNAKPLLFQYVGGRFEFSEFNNPNLTDRFLILIGQAIHRETIDLTLARCISGE